MLRQRNDKELMKHGSLTHGRGCRPIKVRLRRAIGRKAQPVEPASRDVAIAQFWTPYEGELSDGASRPTTAPRSRPARS